MDAENIVTSLDFVIVEPKYQAHYVIPENISILFQTRVIRTAFLFVVFSVYSFLSPVYSQQVPGQPKPEDYERYMKKRKNNLVAGWVLLGSGALLSVGGAAINLKDGVIDNDPTNNTDGLWMVYLGVGSMLLSIPFFIAAGTNKRKALRIKNQPTATLQPMHFRSTPSLTLEISF